MNWKSALKAGFLWFFASNFAAFAGVYFFRHLPVPSNAWSATWAGFHWQLKLWLICLLPAMFALSRDFLDETSDWSLSKLALLAGFGLGPLAAGAFPLEQYLALLPPLAGLALASAWMRWPERGLSPLLATLCLFNLLSLINGIFTLSQATGSLTLAAVLAYGLSPSGTRGAALGFVLALAGLAIKRKFALEGGISTVLLTALIALGWAIAKKRETHLAQTP